MDVSPITAILTCSSLSLSVIFRSYLHMPPLNVTYSPEWHPGFVHGEPHSNKRMVALIELKRYMYFTVAFTWLHNYNLNLIAPYSLCSRSQEIHRFLLHLKIVENIGNFIRMFTQASIFLMYTDQNRHHYWRRDNFISTPCFWILFLKVKIN